MTISTSRQRFPLNQLTTVHLSPLTNQSKISVGTHLTAVSMVVETDCVQTRVGAISVGVCGWVVCVGERMECLEVFSTIEMELLQ